MKKNLFLFFVSFLLAVTIAIGQCGTQRWKVKTLADSEAGSINYSPKKSSVHEQLQFYKPPYHEVNKRDSTEKQVYVMDCILIKCKKEKDLDYHLEVQDLVTDEKMVVEIPDPACVDLEGNSHFSKLKKIRERLNEKVGNVTGSFKELPHGTKIRVTGVGFFDKKNHPTGFKGREIHPVLDLEFL